MALVCVTAPNNKRAIADGIDLFFAVELLFAVSAQPLLLAVFSYAVFDCV
jgi:hypothetical protein